MNQKSGSDMWCRFNEMTWPMPGEAMETLERALRYGSPEELQHVRFSAARVVSAYWSLVMGTGEKRASVVRGIKRAMKVASK